MIKSVLSILVFVSVIVFHSSAFSEGKVRVFNLERAIKLSNYTREQSEALKSNKDYKKLVSEIQSLQKELQALQKKGETNALTWSKKQKQDHVRNGQAKVAKLNELANQEAQYRRNVDANIDKELRPKIESVVDDIVTEKGIGLLVDSTAVFFRTTEFDITDEVVKRINNEK